MVRDNTSCLISHVSRMFGLACLVSHVSRIRLAYLIPHVSRMFNFACVTHV